MATSIPPSATCLQQAHAALSAGDNVKALQLFQQARQERPELAQGISFLIEYLTASQTGAPLAEHWQHALTTTYEETETAKLNVNEFDKAAAHYLLLDNASLGTAINMQANSAGNWQATNADPYFVLAPTDNMIAAGFYELELHMNVEQPVLTLNTKLYLDYGAGFNERDMVSFAIKTNQHASRLVFIKQPVQNLRFDPAEQALTFSVNCFALKPVATTKAMHTIEQFITEKNLDLPPVGDNYQAEVYACYDKLVTNKAGYVSYEEWLQVREVANTTLDNTITEKMATLTNKPVFSLILPVAEQDNAYLEQCVNAVLQQSYPNLELTFILSALASHDTRAAIFKFAKMDPRVTVWADETQVSTGVNRAFENAKGDFVALLAPQDLLARHALYRMVEMINTYPKCQILYSDEDLIDKKGERSAPKFKPDWNPDLFFSTDYISNLVVFNTDLVNMTGGVRAGMGGAQRYDLLLRCLPFIKPDDILHITDVLYHCRELSHDLATAKADAQAREKALSDFFNTNGPKGVTIESGLVPNSLKVQWPIPEIPPKVSLLIPTRDQKAITELAVRSILSKTSYPNYEIVILDNGSVEAETLAFFKQIQQEDNRVSVLKYDHPFNYSAINNFGVKYTQGELVGLINNDIEVITPDWLSEMVSHAIRADIGCVGAKLHYANGRIQHAGVVLGIGGVASHGFKLFPENSNGYTDRLQLVQNYSAVTAACMLVKRTVYDAVGGLNETDLTVGYNDVDFCLKVVASGFRNIWTPFARLVHHESISRGDDLSKAKQNRLKNEREFMLAKWSTLIDNDPCYNPNLTRDADDFGFRFHSSEPLNYENNIIYEWNAKTRQRQHKYACVFVGFDANSVLQDYVRFYLTALSKNFDIYFITTAEKMHESTAQLQQLQELCKSVIVRKNHGYDFGSWCYGVNHYRSELAQYDGVLLNNDSVYGPVYDLAGFISHFEQGDADVLGMTDSNELDYHLQSYFVMYSAKVFNSAIFNDMWRNISTHTNKWDIIKKYEIGFSQRLLRVGKFKLKAYCDMQGYPNLNHTHIHWLDLLTKKDFPFVKIELVKKNPFGIDISNLASVIKSRSNYDVSLIDRH